MESLFGQGKPLGFPFVMHVARAMACAPRSMRACALAMALLPGQPPQLTKPTMVQSPSVSNAPDFFSTAAKSPVKAMPSHKVPKSVVFFYHGYSEADVNSLMSGVKKGRGFPPLAFTGKRGFPIWPQQSGQGRLRMVTSGEGNASGFRHRCSTLHRTVCGRLRRTSNAPSSSA